MRLLLIRMGRLTRSPFWLDAATIDDSVTMLVLPVALMFGGVAGLICVVERLTDPTFTLGLEVSAFEIGGAVLGTLLVLRTNDGLGRWREGRRLWGGITNQCRSLVIAALAYGPPDPAWRRAVVAWTAAFAHVCRRSLRDDREDPEELAYLIGEAEAARLIGAHHMPTHAALVLARLLRTAVDRLGMDRFAYLQADKERALLVDHIGGCERINTTPLPRVYSIQIRRFLSLFLLLLPFGLIPRFNAHDPLSNRVFLVPLITLLVAYPLLSLDRIGSELQHPFATKSLSHLKLNTYTILIEQTLFALLDGPIVGAEVEEFVIGLDGAPAPEGPGPSAVAEGVRA